MSTQATAVRAFLVLPTRVSEIDEDGAEWDYEAPDLYDHLVLAGYPLSDDKYLGGFYIDLGVDPASPDDVVVWVNGGGRGGEYRMGVAAPLFLDWYARNAT